MPEKRNFWQVWSTTFDPTVIHHIKIEGVPCFIFAPFITYSFFFFFLISFVWTTNFIFFSFRSLSFWIFLKLSKKIETDNSYQKGTLVRYFVILAIHGIWLQRMTIQLVVLWDRSTEIVPLSKHDTVSLFFKITLPYQHKNTRQTHYIHSK